MIQTMERQAELPLVPQPIPFNAQNFIERLSDIIVKYDDEDEQFKIWSDPLSKKLFSWGIKLLAFGQWDDTIIKIHLNKLAKKIFINPLDGSSLESPVLERQWVWEEKALSDYQRLSPVSPFDQQPMLPMRIHAFGRAMLSLINSAPADFLRPPSNGTLLINTKSPGFMDWALMANYNDFQFRQYKLAFYQVLADRAKKAQGIASLRDELKKISTQATKLFRESKQLVRQERERAEQAVVAHEQLINQRIESIEQDHQHTVSVLRERVEDGVLQLERAQTELSHERYLNAQNSNEIRRVRAETQSIQVRFAMAVQEIAELKEALRKSKKKKFIIF